jgi:hypothetical protein
MDSQGGLVDNHGRRAAVLVSDQKWSQGRGKPRERAERASQYERTIARSEATRGLRAAKSQVGGRGEGAEW